MGNNANTATVTLTSDQFFTQPSDGNGHYHYAFNEGGLAKGLIEDVVRNKGDSCQITILTYPETDPSYLTKADRDFLTSIHPNITFIDADKYNEYDTINANDNTVKPQSTTSKVNENNSSNSKSSDKLAEPERTIKHIDPAVIGVTDSLKIRDALNQILALEGKAFCDRVGLPENTRADVIDIYKLKLLDDFRGMPGIYQGLFETTKGAMGAIYDLSLFTKGKAVLKGINKSIKLGKALIKDDKGGEFKLDIRDGQLVGIYRDKDQEDTSKHNQTSNENVKENINTVEKTSEDKSKHDSKEDSVNQIDTTEKANEIIDKLGYTQEQQVNTTNMNMERD